MPKIENTFDGDCPKLNRERPSGLCELKATIIQYEYGSRGAVCERKYRDKCMVPPPLGLPETIGTDNLPHCPYLVE